MSSERPRVTVVIPVYNGERVLGHQLDALTDQVAAPIFEVIVADNRSTDGTRRVAESFRERIPHLRVVAADARQGVNHARNRGSSEAQGDLVLICDADDRVERHWVANMVRALESAGVVGGSAIPVSSVVDQLRAPTARDEKHLAETLGRFPYALGANIGFHRSVFDRVNGFDESYVRGHDEADFCVRANLAGTEIARADGAFIYYLQRETNRGVAKQSFHSARTYVQLWTNFQHEPDMRPLSFKRAVQDCLTSVRHVPGLLSPQATRQRDAVRELAVKWGLLVGHLKYRVLGKPPSRQLFFGADNE